LAGLLVLLVNVSALAAAPEPGADEMILSLDRALEIARQENPRIAIGRARRAGAEGARVRSRQGFSPRLTVDAYHLRLDTSVLDNIPTFEPEFPPLFVRRDLGPLDGNVASVELVQPLINLLRDRLLAYDIVAMDETRLQVLKEPGKRAESQSYLWVQRGGPPDHPILLYDYDPSRSQKAPIRLLAGFRGYLLTDGYEAYGKVCAEYGLTAVGCWAHGRRKFDEAIKAQGLLGPEKRKASLAGTAMAMIQQLYRIERETKALSAEERQRVRQERALPLLADIRTWLDEHLPIVPPRSVLGKAMNYAHDQWPKLTVYVEDGRLRIDNNLTENAIRPFVIGRKNWLFCDTVAGANASANLYSLIETAKANGIEPYAYLRTVFTELPQAASVEEIEALLPVPNVGEASTRVV
jgi:transposase